MRFLVQIAVAILTVCLSMSLAVAQNKVVVIPLNSAKKLNNVVTVSAKGGDFTNPVAAINSITDATETNPYLVLIGPGVYTLTQTLVMKPYVTIAGSGREATTLKGAISSGLYETSALVSGADNAVLCDLAIENTGGDDFSIALDNRNSSPVIHDVTATATGGIENYGVFNTSSSPAMSNISAHASGGTDNYGVFNSFSSSIMTNVSATASGGINNIAVNNSGASPSMTNVSATASGGTSNWAVLNSNTSPSMTNVTAIATGGDVSYGVRNSNSSPFIRQSLLLGATDGIYVNGGAVYVIRSSILGGVTTTGGGTLSCVYSDNGVTGTLNSTCQ